MKLLLAKKLRNTLGGWNFLHPRNGSLISSAIIALALGVAFIGCGDGGRSDFSKANSVFVHNGDVYLAGTIYRDQGGGCLPCTVEAALWKNGAIHFQPDTDASFYSVWATGSDVFVLGDDGVQNILWKNGVAQPLPDDDCLGLSNIFVSGDDLYLAGASKKPANRYMPTLWKNGVAQYLDDDNGRLQGGDLSIFVSGSNVYVVGSPAGNESGSPVLWKNGVRQYLDIDSHDDHVITARSLFVSGEDEYVAGTYGSSAVIWKNGVRQVLAEAQQMPGGYYVDSRAYSVSVSDGDVYVAGEVAHQAVIWKNGVMRNLTSKSDHYPAARSVFVSDGDVYVAGNGNERLATVWKNGVAQTLPLK